MYVKIYFKSVHIRQNEQIISIYSPGTSFEVIDSIAIKCTINRLWRESYRNRSWITKLNSNDGIDSSELSLSKSEWSARAAAFPTLFYLRN